MPTIVNFKVCLHVFNVVSSLLQHPANNVIINLRKIQKPYTKATQNIA